VVDSGALTLAAAVAVAVRMQSPAVPAAAWTLQPEVRT
jgi:hypothetical protein